jgi:4-hydroxy-tetrahydrodipicolinate reductase
VGVNLFVKLNEYLAGLMKNYPAYFPCIEEVHHVHKKDIPSGTAIVLAEGILKENKRMKRWISGAISNEDELPVDSVRVGEVPGTHTIYYTSENDEIRITHEAFSRRGFAEGALNAAEWLIGKKGVFGMKDLMNDEQTT